MIHIFVRSSLGSALPTNSSTALWMVSDVSRAVPRSLRSKAFRRSSPNCSLLAFSASLMPSVYTKSVLPCMLSTSSPSNSISGHSPIGALASIFMYSPSSSGGLWPALQNSMCPDFKLISPINIVTNIPCSLSSTKAWFKRVAMALGVRWPSTSVRNIRVTSAINKAAGTPFPLTSPTQKYSWSSSSA